MRNAEQVAIAGRRLRLVVVDPLRVDLLGRRPGSTSTSAAVPCRCRPADGFAGDHDHGQRPGQQPALRHHPAGAGAGRCALTGVGYGGDQIVQPVGHVKRVVGRQSARPVGPSRKLSRSATGGEPVSNDRAGRRWHRRSCRQGWRRPMPQHGRLVPFTTGRPVAVVHARPGPGRPKPAILTNRVAVAPRSIHSHVAPRIVDRRGRPTPRAELAGRSPTPARIHSPFVAVVPSRLGVLPTMHPSAFQHGHRGGDRPTPRRGTAPLCCGRRANRYVSLRWTDGSRRWWCRCPEDSRCC